MAEKKKKAAKKKSAVMLAFESAKDGMKKAKDALKKSETDATKAAVEAAKTVLKSASAAAARERFLTVGGTRIAVLLDKGKNVARIANAPKSYTFTESDANEIIEAINGMASEIETAFKRAMQSAPAEGGEKKRGFTFSSTKTA